MKRVLLAILMAVMVMPVFADTYVKGYTRKDGTYVQGHYRSDPNQYRYDNYSSQGNTNPYTGKNGTQRNEFSNPPAYNKSYGGSRGNGSTGWGSGSKQPCYSAYGCD